MNELIKQIAEQADIKFDKDIEDIDVCIMLPSDLQKFAELIAKKCMCIVAADGTSETNENYREGYSDGRKMAWLNIRKTFEIK